MPRSLKTFTTITNDRLACFFKGDEYLVSAENLILPATTLATDCYWAMFQDCYSLTTAPELPATTLANGCYSGMFLGCSSLTAEAVVPNSVIPVAASYCRDMYCYCNNATPSGNYSQMSRECNED